MNWQNRIICDEAVLVGKPIIRGTRISVEFILGLLSQGWTEQQILENYPQISMEDLQAIFGFTHDCMKEQEFLPLENK